MRGRQNYANMRCPFCETRFTLRKQGEDFQCLKCARVSTRIMMIAWNLGFGAGRKFNAMQKDEWGEMKSEEET